MIVYAALAAGTGGDRAGTECRRRAGVLVSNRSQSDESAHRKWDKLMQSNHNLNDLTQRNVKLIGDMEKAASIHRTVGERVADFVAAGVGSWTFLIVQSVLLVIWIVLNFLNWNYHWDPYPFVLLNLILSFQAAFATPIILMSQNRQALLSDRRNHLDLQINLLAEQENTEQLRMLRQICEKLGIAVDSQKAPSLEEETSADQIVQEIKNVVEPASKTSS